MFCSLSVQLCEDNVCICSYDFLRLWKPCFLVDSKMFRAFKQGLSFIIFESHKLWWIICKGDVASQCFGPRPFIFTLISHSLPTLIPGREGDTDKLLSKLLHWKTVISQVIFGCWCMMRAAASLCKFNNNLQIPYLCLTVHSHNHTIIWEKTHAGSLGHTCRQSRTLFRLLTPSRFLDQSQRNLARTICLGQRGSLWCRNFKIRYGCHGNLEMRTLRSILARNDRHLIDKHPKYLDCTDPQFILLSRKFGFSANFHGNSK